MELLFHTSEIDETFQEFNHWNTQNKLFCRLLSSRLLINLNVKRWTHAERSIPIELAKLWFQTSKIGLIFQGYSMPQDFIHTVQSHLIDCFCQQQKSWFFFVITTSHYHSSNPYLGKSEIYEIDTNLTVTIYLCHSETNQSRCCGNP